MKVSDILSISESFKELENKELGFSTALIVAENIDAMKVPVEVAQKKLSELSKKYLVYDEDGNPVKMGENSYKIHNPEDYARELADLMENEADVGEIKLISKGDLKNIFITPSRVKAILKYIQ